MFQITFFNLETSKRSYWLEETTKKGRSGEGELCSNSRENRRAFKIIPRSTWEETSRRPPKDKAIRLCSLHAFSWRRRICSFSNCQRFCLCFSFLLVLPLIPNFFKNHLSTIPGDVNGSVEAILDVLDTYYSHNQCRLDIVHYGTGSVTESDLKFAESFHGRCLSLSLGIYSFNFSVK